MGIISGHLIELLRCFNEFVYIECLQQCLTQLIQWLDYFYL